MTKKTKAQNYVQQRIHDEDWFNEGVEWSRGLAYKNEDGTHKGYKKLTDVDKKKEKEFGNRMIGQVYNRIRRRFGVRSTISSRKKSQKTIEKGRGNPRYRNI